MVERYQQHVTKLASTHKVSVCYVHGLAPERAYTEGRVAYAAPIVDETTYAVVLHELGHLCHPGHQRNQLLRLLWQLQGADQEYAAVTLEEEQAAWQWAKAHAIEWTPVMTFVRDWALSTYGE